MEICGHDREEIPLTDINFYINTYFVWAFHMNFTCFDMKVTYNFITFIMRFVMEVYTYLCFSYTLIYFEILLYF